MKYKKRLTIELKTEEEKELVRKLKSIAYYKEKVLRTMVLSAIRNKLKEESYDTPE